MMLNSFSFPRIAISNSCLLNGQTQIQTPYSSPFCFFTYPTSWLILLVSSICVYAVCSGFHLLSFLLTCSALILSTIAFSLLRTSSSASDRKPDSQLKTSSLEEEAEPIEVESQRETFCIQKEETQVQKEAYACDCLLSSSPDGPSDTESKDHTSVSEDTESEWPSGGDLDPTQECSDGSISDEESLIEIALPNGYYIDRKKHDQQPLPARCGFQQKCWTDCYSMETFQQQNLMELLAELNEITEEENMIEIDISMGSIKCPRFEIQA